MLVAPVLGPQLLDLYRCTNATLKNYSGAARKSNLTGAGQTVSIVLTGQTLNIPVYETGVPGIGIVIAVRNIDTGCGVDSWYGVNNVPAASVSGWQVSPCNGTAPGDTANSGLQWAVGLVKTAAVVQPGVIAGIQVMQLALLNSNNTIQEGALSGSVNISSVNVAVLSCSTPNVTVPMGTYLATAFKGIGSTTTPVPFSVAINNCPAGMSRIGIQLVAPSGYIDQAGGVINLSSNSTAKGIGVKLTKAPGGAAMTFGAPGYVVPGYNTQTASSSFTMTFNAAYYQTATAVGAGTANALLEFTMNYQ